MNIGLKKNTMKNAFAPLFGFSSAQTHVPMRIFEEASSQKGFRACETTPALLEDMGVIRRNAFLAQFECVSAGGIVSNEAFESILAASRRTRESFEGELEKTLKNLMLCGIHTGTLDLPAGIFESQELFKNAKELFRNIYRSSGNGFTILLSYRIPSLGGTPHDFSRILEKLMVPNVKAHIKIYPHELSRDFEPSGLAGTLRIDAKAVSFCYDAENGSRLVKSHIEKWFDYFSFTGFNGPYFVLPGSHAGRLAVSSGEAYLNLMERMIMERNGKIRII